MYEDKNHPNGTRVHLWVNLTAAINVSRMFLNGEQSNNWQNTRR